MSWITEIREDAAEGRLAECYARVRRAIGRVVPFYRAYSASPRLLTAHLEFYGAVGAPGALSKLRKELIATAVSADNGCQHCTELHAGFLRAMGADEALVRALETAPDDAPLPAADRAIVDYALKLTRTPRAMTRADVEALAAHGLGEAEIFEVAFVTAYFNYTNRVAEGLGVEPESADAARAALR
jgi:uncharacterized peroxidase-related enzyme